MKRCGIVLAATVLWAGTAAVGREAEPPERRTVDQLTSLVRDSVVVVSYVGRDGRSQGMGAGFVVSPDGLIATNLHVIGEARPISVQTSDGRRHAVTEIHATDRHLDLALIRIDTTDLPALELGDSDSLKQGEDVVALGNPRGLEYSVVTGVVSGRREIDGKPMIQLAIPIEPGNSGGPLLDRQGRVHGILTLKSLITRNLGFAVESNALKPLLEKPNPVPMERWLTIGALNPNEWTPLFGARWRQRAGRILVEGAGEGFGGRSLALSQTASPEPPFEVAVTVRLQDESGAAGLVFHSDGGQRHYGFYPSNGRLRLSRFDGPDVFSWNVLHEVSSPHYRPGEWNTLKVRVAEDGIQCFVNDQPVIESRDGRYVEGQAGLAKFRETQAEFKGFQVAKEIPSSRPAPEAAARIARLVEDLPPDRPPAPEFVQRLAPEGAAAPIVLREEARALERRAERLRQLAQGVHEAAVRARLVALFEEDENEIDLLHAGLLLAQLDNDELDPHVYRREVDRLAEELSRALPTDADEAARLVALNRFLFEEQGFHGSRVDYYSRSNSYLNEVIDDREGLPITLAVLYMELARRVGLRVVGVGLPGHFVVRHEPDEGEPRLIDVFDGGAELTSADAAAKVAAITGRPLDDDHLRAQSPKEIIIRMLFNLRRVAEGAGDADGQLRYVETLVALDPRSPEFRAYRTDLLIKTQRIDEALEDVNWFLEEKPAGADLERLRQLRSALEEQSARSR